MEELGIYLFVCFLWRPIFLPEVTGKQGGLFLFLCWATGRFVKYDKGKPWADIPKKLLC